MTSPLNHPWITDPIFDSRDRDSIRVAMKNALAMLEGDNPPQWIITLDECAMWYQARTRVVVAEHATIDVEGDAHDGPVTTLLTDEQRDDLLAVLSSCSPDRIVDVENDVLDGTLCAVAVMNGQVPWCAFSRFNSDGMNDRQLALPGPRIATLLRSFYRSLQS